MYGLKCYSSLLHVPSRLCSCESVRLVTAGFAKVAIRH